jgi:hypothetical protein
MKAILEPMLWGSITGSARSSQIIAFSRLQILRDVPPKRKAQELDVR